MAPKTVDKAQFTRLAAAYHEAGHTIAHQVSGGKVRSVRADSSGAGMTRTAERVSDANRAAYLVMILAGGEAEAKFLTQHGYGLGKARGTVRGGCSSDLRDFRRYASGTGISEHQARRDARKLVCRHWGRIRRLAERLAKNGRISGFWL